MCILSTYINNSNQLLQTIENSIEFLFNSCEILNVKYRFLTKN
jgi:hypothetical protein